MNKKGYTLLEIIIVLGIITIIGVGSIVGVNIVNNKKIEKFYDKFDDALSVYLETHNEVYTNLKENVEGSVITLEVLKNEGLISDNLIDPEGNKIDYENNYYVLSSAKLLDNEEDEEESTDVCEGQVSIEVIKSWETLKDKVDTGNVIYICPKNSDNDDSTNTNNTRIIVKNDYIAMGKDPNNYVEINGTKWRILEITDRDVYLVNTDENLLVADEYICQARNCILITKIEGRTLSNYDLVDYDNIIENSNYLFETSGDSGGKGQDIGNYINIYTLIGTINYSSIIRASSINGNWLFDLYYNFAKNKNMTITLFFGSISLGDDKEDKSGDYVTIGCFKYYDKPDSQRVIYTSDLSPCGESLNNPVIMLKKCIDIKEQCDKDNGSETCPFIIDTSAC